MTIAQDFPQEYSIAYPKAVNRLAKLVIEEDYGHEYLYYHVPIPWLQIKCLRLLQYYPPSDDSTVRDTIHNVLETIVDNSQNTARNVQQNNAQNSVLFEAINLAIHHDTESSVVAKASVLLGRFILSRETNVRYLGLDTMAHLAACAESLEPVKMHQETIILSLRDKDISVRRRGLDLLYSMCDVTNAKRIVSELLRYLQVSDYALREELVLKIAILTEKFATEYSWYVDTILQLISSAGDHVGDEVWYRVCQIVTNNEEVQEYASKKVFEHLQSSSCHENLIKVGGYILGEFGHLIANDPGASPIEQFHALHSRSHLCSQPTRALLLTTYVKWLNLFPEIREQILYVLNRYRHVLDAELQQRACEYVALAMMPDDELLQAVCDEMPPFQERSSLLLNRLQRKHGDTEDKRTWIIGGKEVNKDRDQARQESLKKGQVNGGAMPTGPAASVIANHQRPDMVTADAYKPDSSGDLLAGLQGLDMSAGAGTAEAAEGAVGASRPLIGTNADEDESRGNAPLDPQHTSIFGPSTATPAPNFTPGTTRAFHRLCFTSDGVLYEDSQLQIGLKSEYHGHMGRVALYFGNKISVGFSSFTMQVQSQEPEKLVTKFPKMPFTSLNAMTQVQQVIEIECHDVFSKPPVLKISYLAGSMQELHLRLPVVLTKFIEPVQLNAADFFERWRQIGGPPREAQQVFDLKLKSKNEADTSRLNKVIVGSRVQVLSGVDKNPANTVGAGVLHMSHGGKVGCLLRNEPNAQAKVRISIFPMALFSLTFCSYVA